MEETDSESDSEDDKLRETDIVHDCRVQISTMSIVDFHLVVNVLLTPLF